ncbi:MAG: response regulator [Candidatus Heimdallarchaeota archaeon]|nr:MAG: response regulator [Candidatus Heimdallarchaeota archaeon]
MKGVIKVFLIDDSAVIRHQITKMIIDSQRNIEVIGGAPNGKIALMKMALPKYSPDVVLVDAIMPEMDGFETIKHIMDRFPTPVIMISGLSKREVNRSLSNIGMSVFESGGVEFVKKPDPMVLNDVNRFKRELFYKISNLSQIDLARAYAGFDFKTFLQEEETKPTVEAKSEVISEQFSDLLLVIGASTGGPRAISLILSKIPVKSPPIIVVQHMPEQMVDPWVKRLQSLYPHLIIKIPNNKEKILPNRVYIAPGGKHCGINRDKTFRLFIDERINFVIPAIDVTFVDAARVYKKNVLGIVLTGMGKDGFLGAEKIKSVGGKIFAEHESTCVIPSMPKAIIEGKYADEIIPLHKIPILIHKHGWI